MSTNLTTKYRPASLSAVRGHAGIIRLLKSFAQSPVSKAFLFSGPPGSGKTSSAYALAAELGVDVDKKEWGGLHEIASGAMML